MLRLEQYYLTNKINIQLEIAELVGESEKMGVGYNIIKVNDIWKIEKL